MPTYNLANNLNYGVPSEAGVWIARRTDGVIGTFLPVGNIAGDPAFNPEVERLEHSTNLYGLNARDRNVVIKRGLSFDVPIDELVGNNLELLLGSASRQYGESHQAYRLEAPTFVAGTLQINSGNAVAAIDSVRPLRDDNTGTGTTPLVYDEGPSADYETTLATGTITLTPGSAIGTEDQVVVYYRTDETGVEFSILESPNINGAMRFLILGGGLGPNRHIYFPNVDINLEGSITFGKSDWGTATLRCTALADAASGDASLGEWYNW